MERVDIIRQNETKFLAQHGFTKLMKDQNVKYINITEEIWAGKSIDSTLINHAVNEKFSKKLENPELLNTVPKKIYDYKGCTLISLAKVKGIILPGFQFFTLSQKNLFGMIPDTCRRHYHGKPRLNNAIIDMNLIYRSLFDVVGICEAIFETLFISDKDYIIENSGCMVGSRDLVTLDAAIIKSLSFEPQDRNIIKMSSNVFNQVDKDMLKIEILENHFYPLLDAAINLEKIKQSKEIVQYVI
jgi:uncharacterized protein (DUF362 family)